MDEMTRVDEITKKEFEGWLKTTRGLSQKDIDELLAKKGDFRVVYESDGERAVPRYLNLPAYCMEFSQELLGSENGFDKEELLLFRAFMMDVMSGHDYGIDNVLEFNPFSKELVEVWRGTFGKIDERIKNEGCYNLNSPDAFKFVLPGDEGRFEKIPAIRTQYIPQPFIGHPSAPIWILNQNPSWFQSDLYSMFDVSQKAIVESEKPLDGRRPNNRTRIKKDSFGVDELRNRQSLLLAQLRLFRDGEASNDDPSFFPLDAAFMFDANLERACSVGLWWRKFVAGAGIGNDFPLLPVVDEPKTIARHVFVVEAFPYRSAHWNDVESVWREGPYYDYWRHLVKYGYKNGKMLVVRGGPNGDICKEIQKVVGASKRDVDDRLFYFSSVQHPTLSNGNLCQVRRSGDELRKVIDRVLESPNE